MANSSNKKLSAQEKEELLNELTPGSQTNLSKEEEILFEGNLQPTGIHLTVNEFANQYEGNTLSILYKDGKQRGFVRLGGKDDREVFSTLQTIVFNIENPPVDGVVNFNLKDYR